MISHSICLPGDTAYKDFEELPYAVYPPAVAACRRSLPTGHLLHCLVVYKDRIPVARIALYDNPLLQYDQYPVLLAGGFEGLNEPDAIRYLFETCDQSAIHLRKKYIVGPINGSTWEDYRLNLPGTGIPFFSETIYPSYYAGAWMNSGFEILHSYHSAVADITGNIKASIASPGIRNLRLDNFEQELSRLHKLCMTAFAGNPFFSPIDEAYFISKYMQIRNYIDEEMVLVAENEVTGAVEAFTFCLPDVFDNTGSSMIIKTIAKDPKNKTKGLVTGMLSAILRRAYEKGYTKMIHAYMHEENSSNRISQFFNGKVFRKYALFIKAAGNDGAA